MLGWSQFGSDRPTAVRELLALCQQLQNARQGRAQQPLAPLRERAIPERSPRETRALIARPKMNSPRLAPSPRLPSPRSSLKTRWVHFDEWMHGEDYLSRFRPPDVVKPVKPAPRRNLQREDLERAFKEIDDDGNGYLEPEELKLVFEKAGMAVTDKQIEMAMSVLDENGDGHIDMDEFNKLREIITSQAFAAAKDGGAGRGGGGADLGALGALGEMGETLLQGMMSTVMNEDFVKKREAPPSQKQRTQSVSGEMLGRMLDEAVPKLVAHDDDGPPLTAADLKEKLRKNLERVIDSFRKFDKDNSGTIDIHEWTTALKRLFRKAKEDDLEALFLEFDSDGGGTVDYEEFACTLKAAEPVPKKVKRKTEAKLLFDM